MGVFVSKRVQYQPVKFSEPIKMFDLESNNGMHAIHIQEKGGNANRVYEKVRRSVRAIGSNDSEI